MNEWTHFFIKIYLSHFIIERVMFVVCERWAGDRDRLLYWSKFFLEAIAALLPHLGCVAQPWVTEGPKISVCRWSSLRHLASNWFEPLIYTGASLDWRLGRGSIYDNHPILIFKNFTCGNFLHARLHHPHTHILKIMIKDYNCKSTNRNYLNNSKYKNFN